MEEKWRRAYRGGPPLYLIVLIVVAVLLATGVIPTSWLV